MGSVPGLGRFSGGESDNPLQYSCLENAMDRAPRWAAVPGGAQSLTQLKWLSTHISSVQFSCSVVSDSLRPHESEHTRPPCPSPTPGVHSDWRPSSPWCHPAISSSVVPFSSCPQSLPASESFPVSQLIAWGGQSTGASALASFLPKKSQGWSPSHIHYLKYHHWELPGGLVVRIQCFYCCGMGLILGGETKILQVWSHQK